jgi:integrase
VIESDPKTEKSRRPISLDSFTVATLREWRVRQLEERLLCGEGWVDNGLVFTRPDGSGLHPDRVSKLFDLAVARAGVPRIRFHDLRHTWTTTALRAGVHHKIVSERLGHSRFRSPSTSTPMSPRSKTEKPPPRSLISSDSEPRRLFVPESDEHCVSGSY